MSVKVEDTFTVSRTGTHTDLLGGGLILVRVQEGGLVKLLRGKKKKEKVSSIFFLNFFSSIFDSFVTVEAMGGPFPKRIL
jgi:hypothetical protein